LYTLDVVIAPELFAQGLFAALFMPKKLITRIHTPTSIGDRYNDRPLRLVTRVLTLPEWFQAWRSRMVSVASTHLATIVENEWRIPRARMRVIPNSVQIDWVRSLAETRGHVMPKEYLLYFGRLEPKKGVRVLSDALDQVLARRSDVAMVFIGSDGGLRETLRRAHRERADRVHLFEAMDKAPLFAAIRGARLVVLPSLFENMSNAGLEAMALARPVLGTFGTAFEEIIEDGVNGFLTPPGDAAALAAKILSCLERPDLEEIGRRGFETVRRFDAHAVAPLYAELCREVASGL
jgi:glycosyltransferase involved in cell wall biosynthesis